MRLPSAEDAIVPAEKITGYLLSSSHPVGRTKAAFFCRFGFTQPSWAALAEALRDHAMGHDVASASQTPFGVRYTVEGRLECPDGRGPMVRTVWFIETGETIPRFVTAYPSRRRYGS
jgi:hypothetical protein